jgi:hypothetical protein
MASLLYILALNLYFFRPISTTLSSYFLAIYICYTSKAKYLQYIIVTGRAGKVLCF